MTNDGDEVETKGTTAWSMASWYYFRSQFRETDEIASRLINVRVDGKLGIVEK